MSTIEQIPITTEISVSRAIPFWRQLRWNLVAYAVLLTFIPALIVGVFVLQQTRTQTLAQIDQQLESITTLKLNQITRWLDTSGQVMDVFLSNNVTHDVLVSYAVNPDEGFLSRSINTLLRNGVESQSQADAAFNEFFLYDLNGKILASSDEAQIGKIVNRQPYFAPSLQGNYVQSPYYDISTSGLTMFVTRPLLQATGEPIAVVAGRLDLTTLGNIMSERVGLAETGESYLVSSENNYLLTPSRFEGYEQNRAYRTEGINQALNGVNGSGLYLDYRGVPIYGVYRWVPELKAAFLAEIDESEALALYNQTATFGAVVVGVAVLGAVLIALYIATRIAKPIIALTDVASGIASGDLTQRAQLHQRNEIGLLAATFNSMADQLQDSVSVLEERVDERTRDLQTIAEVSTQISTILDVDRLLQSVVDLTKERFQLYHAHIYLLDEAGKNLVLAAGAGEAGRKMKALGRRIPLNHAHSLVARAARSRQGVISNDVTREPDFLPNPLLPDTKSEMAVPMVAANRLVGVLDVQADSFNRFTIDDVRTKTTLADQVAVAIQNAQAFNITERQVSDLRAQSQIAEALRIGGANFEDVLENILSIAGNALGATNVLMAQYDPNERAIYGIAGAGEGMSREFVASVEEPIARVPHAQEAIRTGQVVAVDDTRSYPGFPPEYLDEKIGVKSVMTLPLFTGNFATGVIFLNYNHTAHAFTQDEITLGQSLANQISISLERKRAEDAVRESEARYQQIMDGVSDLILVKGEKSRIVWANKAFREYYGMTQEALQGMIDASYVEPDYTQQYIQDDAYVFENGVPLEIPEEPIQRYDGEIRYFQTVKTPIFDQNGKVFLTVGVSRDITARKQQEAAIQEAREEAEILYQLGSLINKADSPQEIAEAIAQYAIPPEVVSVSLSMYDNGDYTNAQHIEIVGNWQRNGQSVTGLLIPLADFKVTSPQDPYMIQVIGDVENDPQVTPESLAAYKSFGVAGILSVPLMIGGRLMGTIAINTQEPYSFEEHTIRLFRSIAEQTATMLERMRVTWQAEQRAAELETVAKVSAATTTIMDMQELLQNVVDLTKESFDLYHAHIYLLDDAGQNLVLAAGAGEPGRIMREQGRSIPLNKTNSLVARAGRERQGAISNDVTQEPDFLPNPMLPNTRSEMAVPMLVGNELVGVLDMQASTVNRFTDEDVRVKTALADQVAVAVQNARAFSRIQAAQEELRASEEQLQAILDNATAVIYVKEKGGKYLTINKSYERLFHLNRDEVRGKTDYDIFPKEVADSLRIVDSQVWDEGKVVEQEELIPQDDGIHNYFSVKFPLRDGNGEVYAMAGISTDMTERQQAEAERRIIFEVAGQLNQAQSRDEVLAALLPYARTRNVTAATLMYIDVDATGTPEWAEIVGDWHVEGTSTPVGTRFYLPGFPFAKLWMSNPSAPTLIDNIKTSPLVDDLTRQAMEETNGQALVLLPLVAQNQWIGLLSFVWSDPTAFNDQDRRIYTSMMSYATATIDALRAAEETRNALAQTEALYMGSDRISHATTYDEVLLALVESTAIQQMGSASIGFFNRPWVDKPVESMTLISVWSKDGQPPTTPVGTVYPLDQFPMANYMRPDEPLVIQDADTIEGVDDNLRALLKQIGMVSLVAMPIIANGEWIASLVAQHTEPGTLTEDQLRQISALTDQAATKIQSIRLLEETQKRAAELETVAKVSAAATTIMNVDDLLQSVVDLTKQSFQLYHAHIYLLDDVGQNLVLAAGAGEAGRIMRENGHSIPLNRLTSLVARAGRERVGVISNDVTLAPDFLANPLLPETRSEMAVPMLIGNELVGVLDVQSEIVNRFTDSDIAVQSTLADQVAVAVQNARAFTRITTAQEAARELNERFQSIGETMPGAIFQFTFSNGVWATPYMSQGIYDIVGVSAEDVMRDLNNFTERVHPDDLAEYAASITRVIETLEPWSFEGRLIKPSGEVRWWTAASLPTRLASGEIVFNGVIFDITERKQAEQERETLLAMSTALTDARTPDDVLSAVTGYMRTLGKGAYTLYYVDLEEGIPTWLESKAVQADEEMPWVEVGARFYLPEFPFAKLWLSDPNNPTLSGDVSEFAASQPETYAMFKGGGIESVAVIPLYLQGRWIGMFSFTWLHPIRFTDQHKRVLTSFMHQAASTVDAIRSNELNERRAAEFQTVAQVSAAATMMLHPEELLQSVVELTKESFGLYHAHIYLLDETGEYLVLTSGAGEAGHIMRESGHRISINQASSLVARAGRTREAVIINDVAHTPDFLPNPLLPETQSEMAIPLIVGDDLIGVLDVQDNIANRFTASDIAVQSTLADQIAVAIQNARAFQYQQETAERLREVDRLKSQFLANMSHELRTPLNSIIGYAEVLLDGIDGDLSEEAIEDVQAIHGGGKHLLTIINDILDLAKIEAGQMFMDRQEADLTRAVDEVVNTVNILAKNKGIDLNVEVEGEIPTVFGDPIRLKQIILNLVNNAIKFTEQGSVTINLGMMNDNNQVVVSVRDTGIGMTQEDMAGLFQQFHQVDGSATRRAGGTGLGLVITRHLVHMHEGEIYVDSQKGTGSTFWFTLPVFVGQAAQKA
jgi:PAS domain S-box-containing protein